ncbi:restriction endonuclease subunit S [Vibrio metschnikovii]|uniref:restriction endonuclease subunit S n=1 Tax=Vibrio metschnikovii TaxID=28172 RepID=UPI002FC638F9|nr:restriction endonuclease subunit S [Vibrio metschnikovii]
MTGRYKAYPEYKDSGLRWLPELPSNWKVERTKRMFALKRSLVGNQSSDYQLLSLTLKGVVPRDISSGEGKIPESFDTYQKVDENDLIFCLFDMDETPRTIGISPLNGMITGAYNVYGCLESCCANYAYYYFLHIDSFKGLKPFYTGLRKVVRAETFGNIEMPCPSFEEQQKIASFLDHETAKIDTLIAKQEKLIELLKEKRQAVISHAVTKGLNPNAPMKDSGVEWLGEVPEHWVVTKLKWKTSTTSGGTPTTSKYEMYYKDGYIPWIRTTDLNNGKLLETPVNITSKALADTACSILPKNSILLAMYGGAGSIGKHSLLMFEATINQAVCGIYPSSAFESEFLHYFYEFYRPFWMINAAGTRKDPNIGQDHIKEGKVVLPPVAEQRTIVAHINKTLALLDRLNVKATDAIELAKERKTALISAAVTGKIDVRHFVAEQGQPQGVQG